MQGRVFEYAIMAVIVANSALMATSFYGQPEEMAHVVEAINYAFTCIYVVEFVLKVRESGHRRETQGCAECTQPLPTEPASCCMHLHTTLPPRLLAWAGPTTGRSPGTSLTACCW